MKKQQKHKYFRGFHGNYRFSKFLSVDKWVTLFFPVIGLTTPTLFKKTVKTLIILGGGGSRNFELVSFFAVVVSFKLNFLDTDPVSINRLY